MDNVQVRCLMINLDKKEIQSKRMNVKELSDRLGTYGIYQTELNHIWKEDKEAVGLATGPLTGIGIPGSGVMMWCTKESNSWNLETTEGRLGAVLRSAGYDHMILQGSCSEDVDILINDSDVVIQQADRTEDKDVWTQLLNKRPDVDSAVAYVETKGIREDKLFFIGSAEISGCLKKKGIRSIIITGAKGIGCADPLKLLEKSIELSVFYKRTNLGNSERKNPARYLSLNHSLNEEDKGLPRMPLDFLGLGWDEEFPGEGMEDLAAEFLTAYTGENWTKEDVDKVKEAVERGIRSVAE